MSEAAASILGALIAGVFALVGVAIGYYLSRRASEADRRTELQYTIYRKMEQLKNLLMAFKKRMISAAVLHEKWTLTTEEVLVALIRSGLSRNEKKRILHAINGRWENPQTIKDVDQLAKELLTKLDPEFAQAADELLEELGVKPEDIDPVVLTSKSTRK